MVNAFLYSPQLISSRVKLLNLYYYVNRGPVARRHLLRSLAVFFAQGMMWLTLAKAMGAEVGMDIRSADFGKIKVGNTRIDVWGGFAQYLRMAGQLISGQYVSSTTGKIYMLGEGYKPMTRWDILWRQIESKESPLVSFITGMLRQVNYAGEPFNIPKELAIRFVPMIAQDIYDLIKEEPENLPLIILPFFGIGLQTYSDKNKLQKRRRK